MTIAPGQHGKPSVYCLPSGVWRADVRVRDQSSRVKIVAAQRHAQGAAIRAMWDKVRENLGQDEDVTHTLARPCACAAEDHLLTDQPQREVGLTATQRTVLDLVSRGRTNAAIARQLGTTEAGVRHHVHKALAALGARNRAHAVRVAVERGLLRLGPAAPSGATS